MLWKQRRPQRLWGPPLGRGAEAALRRRISRRFAARDRRVAWSDPVRPRSPENGSRPRSSSRRATGTRFAFCEAALGWNTDGTVIDSPAPDQLGRWVSGCLCGLPDFSAPLPWRPGVPRHLRRRHAPPAPSLLDPAPLLLRQVLDRLAGLGYRQDRGRVRSSICTEADGSDHRAIGPIRWRTPIRTGAVDPVNWAKRWPPSRWRASRPSTGPAGGGPTWCTPIRWPPPTTVPTEITPPGGSPAQQMAKFAKRSQTHSG